jgi:trigger factor
VPAVETTVTELPESRVRVEAQVPPDEVERRLTQTARALGRGLKLPGFRKGKVPAPLVIQRLGRAAVLDETVRESLGAWYADAIDASGIAPVGDPTLDLGDLPGEGQPLTFSIEIGVRPKAIVGPYRGVEVGRREPAVAEEAVEREIEALRERHARLETAQRAAQANDFVVLDYDGAVEGEAFAGGTGRDQLVELGTGRLVPGFEEALIGAAAGEEREVSITFPDDYENRDLAGRPATFAVTVKEVKEKRLPELDDDFASDTAGFETLEELREDIRAKLLEHDERTIESEFREAALDAVVAGSQVDVPAPLAQARAGELWERMVHTLGHQGISKDAYLRIAGKTEEEVVAQALPEAEQALKREAVIAAIVEAEGIEPDDESLAGALGPVAAREGVAPEELIERARERGSLDALRAEVASRDAVELVASEANPIPAEQAAARDKLWTPGKEDEGSRRAQGKAGATDAPGGLWTPNR